MLVRLLGKETEATAGTWQVAFYDVVDWAQPYVGYAYTNGLTEGAGDNYFGGDENVSASQYLTFVLRALGYSSETDFQWDKAWVLSDAIGFTYGQYNDTSEFTRGDAAIVSYRALGATIKGSDITLYSMIAKKLGEVPVEATDGYTPQQVVTEDVVQAAENEVPSYNNPSNPSAWMPTIDQNTTPQNEGEVEVVGMAVLY